MKDIMREIIFAPQLWRNGKCLLNAKQNNNINTGNAEKYDDYIDTFNGNVYTESALRKSVDPSVRPHPHPIEPAEQPVRRRNSCRKSVRIPRPAKR